MKIYDDLAVFATAAGAELGCTDWLVVDMTGAVLEVGGGRLM
jgi:hypothetical protein